MTECGDRDQRNNGHVGESHTEDKRELREEEHLECARKRNHNKNLSNEKMVVPAPNFEIYAL